ncbi:MAG: hypothetical protein QXH10_10305 [Ignisphaera sp.]
MNEPYKFVIVKHVIKYLYNEYLYRLKLKGLVGVIGSISFNDYASLRDRDSSAPSDLDLIILLTPRSYVKYLMLQALHGSTLGLPSKLNIKGFKVSISYESIPISWLIGTINYINLFELKIVSLKTLLPEKSLTSHIMHVPLTNAFELFISSLTDLICVCNDVKKERNRSGIVFAKRLKFLGYIYCLVNHFDFLSKYRNRVMCLELLKYRSKGDNPVDVSSSDCDMLDSFVGFFTRVFAAYVLRLKMAEVPDSELVSRAIVNEYLDILQLKKKRRFFQLLISLSKHILRRSAESLAELRFCIKYGYSLPDFLRLSVLIITNRIARKENISKNIISNLCYMWEKVMT